MISKARENHNRHRRHLRSRSGYGDPPTLTSTAKEFDNPISEYRRFIEASAFAILATSGAEGLDCVPRGDRPGLARIADDRSLILPDRRGNNRIDSLRSIGAIRPWRCCFSVRVRVPSFA
jgi:hypothetical protein